MKTKQNLAYKFALISVFFWSTAATAFKITLTYLSPLELLFYSSLSSFFVLGAIVIYQKKSTEVIFHIKNRFSLVFILGAINPFIYYLALFKAYDMLPAQEAQAINYTWSLMFTYLGVIFLKQKLSKGDILAGLICYFGVLVIATKGNPFSLEFSNFYGVSLALFSTILWSTYWILNTKLKVDGIVGLFSNFFIGMVLISFYIIFKGGINLPNFQASLGAIYIGFFEMGITFVFWLKAVSLTSSLSKISNLIFLSPFLSLIFIYFFVGEKILLSTIVALFLIILGLTIQQKWK
ncbi:MAG: DMT family transporter [Sulfurospirillum sp.]|nr:DMT family transporter [Sulfurospirillum sp.]MBL0703193.1 DMT family transporter [Sulfurospirillum sp.]